MKWIAASLLGLALADDKKVDGPVIGIDLGTTYSCVGIYKNGRVEIIPNDQGNRITPSYVSFVDEERLIGEAAKNQATINPAQTLFDVKRLIGRRYKDSTVQKDKKLLPFEIIDKDSKPMIQVDVRSLPSIFQFRRVVFKFKFNFKMRFQHFKVPRVYSSFDFVSQILKSVFQIIN